MKEQPPKTIYGKPNDNLLGRIRMILSVYETDHNSPILSVTIEPFHDNITNQQRRYFFGVIVDHFFNCMADQGNIYEKSDITAWLKQRFMQRSRFCPIAGEQVSETISLSSSSKGMTDKEFSETLNKLNAFSREFFGCEIPEPQ